MKVQISIIVPIFNSEKYLERCLDSLINQTFKNIEIILVNDGSTDSSREIISRYLNKDNRLKCIDKKNEGQASARNLGLSIAKGEYISFIDSDDWIEINMLEKMYDFAIINNADVCMCGINYHYEKQIIAELPKLIKNKKEAFIDPLMASPCNKVYKKSMLKNIKFYEGGIKYEDLYFNMIVYMNMKKIVHLQEIYYNYDRTNIDSTISTVSERVLDILIILNEINLYYKKNNKFLEYYNELEFINIYSIIGTKIPAIFRVEDVVFQKKACIKINEYLNDNFSDWRKNKYLFLLNKKQKLIFKLFKNKLFFMLKMIMLLKNSIKYN